MITPRRSWLAALLTGWLLLLGTGVPALAVSAPTPTTPHPGGPPVGRGPDGTVIGGHRLATRGPVIALGAPALPAELSARGWLVADLDSGDVLAARDPHGKYYPASTLKTLTLLALYDELDPAQVVTGTFEDAGVEGTKVGIVEGGAYPVRLLFLALMLQSGNDAANALARAAGGTEATVDLMNDTAAQLQAYDTVAGTPSGLDVGGQSSSPYDLALILRQILADPDLVEIMAAPTAVMPAVPPRYPAFEFQNGNRLLGSYPGALAGKTGFTDAARHTYVGAARRDGRTLVVTLMQGEQQPVPMWQQAALLLDWGFAVPAGTPPVGELIDPLAPGQSPPTRPPAASPAPVPGPTPGAAARPPMAESWSFAVPLALALGGVVLVFAVARMTSPRRGRPRR